MANPEVTTLEDYTQDRESSYSTYSEYKSFEEEWLDEIPSGWNTGRFRSKFGYIKGNKPDESGDERTSEYDTPYLSMEYLRGEVSTPKFVNSNEENLVHAENDDILLLWDGSNAGEFVRAKEGMVSSTMAKLFLREENDIDYLFYQLKVLEKYLQNTTVGMGIPHVNPKILNNIELIVPPKEEQKAIADFLNAKTKLLDQLIERKKKLIQLLDEKRTVLITETVTQGLDPDIEFKDSGVPGLGEVPEIWDIVPLKHSSQNITSGLRESTHYYVDDGVPALRSLNIKSNEIVEDELVYFSEEDNKELKSSQVQAGDLVSVRSGVNASTTAVVPEKLDGVNCIDLIIIRDPDGYIPEFLSFLMNSEASTRQIEARTGGAAVQHFNVEKVKELAFPKPSIEEQREILDWLSPRLNEIDELKRKVEEGIERLREYRTAIITEAVTGQIDVRGEV